MHRRPASFLHVFAIALLVPVLAAAAEGTWIRLDPGPRMLPSFAADPARDRMILFGGANGTNFFNLAGFLNDTWQLDLSGDPKWTQLSASGPPPRIHAVMIHDPTRDRLVLFGGKTTGAVGTDHNDVWIFDLASNTWSPLPTAGTPPAPFATHGIYDPVRDRMVTFGGFRAGSGPTNEVWELTFAGTPTWTLLTPSGSTPSPRYNLSVIYDPFGDRLIAFGGMTPGGRTNEVRALSLAGSPGWTQLTPAGTPPASREAHVSVYDPLRMRMIMFGGFTNGFVNDIWALDLSGSGSWSPLVLDGAAPWPRDFGAFEYDAGDDRLVLYGGNTAIQGANASEVLGDLYLVDLENIPTAIEVSAAEPEAQPDRVLLRWQVSSLAQTYEVFRSEDRAVWQSLGTARAAGAGVLTWEDREVRSGVSYSYRLRYVDEGTARFGGELTVAIPHEFQLALRAPVVISDGRLTIEMTLPKPGDAQVAVFDVSGRRLLEQSEVRTAGRHAVDLGANWSPGIYWVRLSRAGATTQRQVTILR